MTNINSNIDQCQLESDTKMPILRIGDLEAARGQVTLGRLPVGRLLDGTQIQLPLILVNGEYPGPILGLFATLIGSDYEEGIDIIQRITREHIDPKELKGGIIACPLVNAFAFIHRTHCGIEDKADMQRSFPGEEDGSVSKRLAYLLFNKYVKQCDAVIDFHSKRDIDWSVVFTHDNDQVRQKSRALAKAYGTPIIEMSHKELHNSLCVSAMDIGIPAFISEPMWPPIYGNSIGVSIKGVLNVLKFLGMIPGNIEEQTDNLVPQGFYKRIHIYAHNPGIVRPFKAPGDPVKAGEIIAEVRDMWGTVVEKVVSPKNGFFRVLVDDITPNRVVQMGGQIAEIFEITGDC